MNNIIYHINCICSPVPSNPPTSTPTPTITVTPTKTSTPTVTPTKTLTPTVTPTKTLTPTVTPTPTKTSTPTVTPTKTSTPTVTPTKTLLPTATPTKSPNPCCPSSLWSGYGQFNITSSCPNEPPSTFFSYNPISCNWSAIKILADGVNTITMTISCNPNIEGCGKWSATVSTTCPNGTISLGNIITPCENTIEPNGPPVWDINFDPGDCGCPQSSSSSSS